MAVKTIMFLITLLQLTVTKIKNKNFTRKLTLFFRHPLGRDLNQDNTFAGKTDFGNAPNVSDKMVVALVIWLICY